MRTALDPAFAGGSIGFRQSIVAQIRQTRPTVREYLKQTRYTGSGHHGFVGTPEQFADHIEDWWRSARRVGWLAAAAVHRDHPYNLARRIASADHLANGRSGLVLGLSDGYAPAGWDGHEVWGGAGLTEGAPIGLTTTLDAASAIREFWQSWPRESIVADRRARIYARGDQIVAVDHRGIFHIDGPLTVPTTPQGSPVLAWRARTGQEAAVARDIADVIIWPAGQDYGPGVASASAVAPAAVAPAGARLFLEVPAGGGDLGARLRDHLADDRVAGVILRPAGDEPALREFIAGTVPDLIAAGTIRAATGRGTLRERLSLPAAGPLPFAGRPAFPAPVPQHGPG